MDMTNLLILALQGAGALLLVLMGNALKKISQDSEENRKSINSISGQVGELALKMSEHYVTKDDWNVTRDRLHELTGTVRELKTRMDMRVRGAE